MARPRSEKAHHKVLEAALALFAKYGIDATSMDSISATSGVSKATIYKHWPDKDALALEVVAWLYELDEQPRRIPQKGIRDDLIAALQYRPAERRTAERERIMPHLIAYSARNQVFGKAWRAKVVKRHCDMLEHVLRSAIDNGKLHSNLPIDFAVAMLFGPMMYQKIFVSQSRTDPPPPEFVAQVVDAFLQVFENHQPLDPREAATAKSRPRIA